VAGRGGTQDVNATDANGQLDHRLQDTGIVGTLTSLDCPKCGTTNTVKDRAKSLTCASCRVEWRFKRCEGCEASSIVAEDDDGRWTCPRCSRRNAWLAKWSNAAAAGAEGGLVARRETENELASRRQSADIALPRATYLGGFKGVPDFMEGLLSFGADGIAFKDSRDGRGLHVAAAEIGSLLVTSEQVAKSRVGPVLAFGVLGLAAKGSRNQATVVIRTKGDEGEAGYFTIQRTSAVEVKAKLDPWLRARRVPWYEDQQHDELAGRLAFGATSPPLSIADELDKLGGLRQSGVLSDEEFDTLKARLISG
jgi:ribosomal protein S27AE